MKTRISRVARACSLIAVIAGLAFAPAALAQSSSVSAYKPNGNNQGQNVAGNQQGGGTTEPAVQTSAGGGTLPFTGLDIGFLIGGGLLLVAVGAAMARITPRGNTS